MLVNIIDYSVENTTSYKIGQQDRCKIDTSHKIDTCYKIGQAF